MSQQGGRWLIAACIFANGVIIGASAAAQWDYRKTIIAGGFICVMSVVIYMAFAACFRFLKSEMVRKLGQQTIHIERDMAKRSV